MSNLFSEPAFLRALAEIRFPDVGAAPATARLADQDYDLLLCRDGTVATSPLVDFYEPRAGDAPLAAPPVPIAGLPRVVLDRVALLPDTPACPPGQLPAPFVDWRRFDSFPDFVTRTRAREWRAFKDDKRKRRRLERLLGRVRIEPDLPDHDLLEQLLTLKARRLRRTGNLDRFASRRNRQLLHRLLADRVLRLSVLFGGDRAVALNLGHWGEKRVSFWITAYDPEAGAVSPGLLLFEALMRESWERGHEELDFLAGGEPYKYFYATDERRVGPLGVQPLLQRVTTRARAVLDQDGPVRAWSRGLALRAVQVHIAREPLAPVAGEPAWLAPIERHTPGWPDLRFDDAGACQLAVLMDHDVARTPPLKAGAIWGRHTSKRALWGGRKVLRRLRRRLDGATGPTPADPKPLHLRSGEAVRVRSRAEILSTLADGKTGGLAYMPATMDRYTGQVFQVERPVTRFYDERLRTVVRPRRAVVLTGAVCDGVQSESGAGCDRACPVFWSEAWLERLEQGTRVPSPPALRPSEGADTLRPGQGVRIRGAAEIAAIEARDPDPRGVRFVPETMAAWCGRETRVRGAVHHAYDERRGCDVPLADTVLLEDTTCLGAAMVAAGPCDRACALLWRTAWLEAIGPAPAEAR